MSWDGAELEPEDAWPEPTDADVVARTVAVHPDLVRLVETLPKRRDGFTQEARATVRGVDTGARFDLRPAGAGAVEVRVKRHGTVSVPHGSADEGLGDVWQLVTSGVVVPQLWTSSEAAASIAWASVAWERAGRPGPLRFEWGRRPVGASD